MLHVLREVLPSRVLAAHETLLTELLRARGLTDAAKLRRFLQPDFVADRHDPLLLPDIEPAVARLTRAIAHGEKIAIFADYDCDGIPGAVLCDDFLEAIGHSARVVYIPHRHYEGYGLSESAVETLADSGATLLLTIDCGTNDHAAIARARARGMDVIITDHHERTSELPEACAVVNPKAHGNYPDPELCGAGVVYKLVEAVLSHTRYGLPYGYERWWLDMVAIATIGDMVPLHGENRILAQFGLTVLRKSRRPGLQQLCRKLGVTQQSLTEDEVGFLLVPRINAASRMDAPEDAFALLRTRDTAAAEKYALHLERVNRQRKSAVALIHKAVRARVHARQPVPPVIVMGDKRWRPSLLGLVAHKLADEYQRPVFLWGQDGHGVLKGSCRAGGDASVVALMAAAGDALQSFGGHTQSGGFTIAPEHAADVESALLDAYTPAAATPAGTPTPAATLALADVTNDLYTALSALAPFGMANPKPCFSFPNVVPHSVRTFGAQGEHLRVCFTDTPEGFEAVAFFAATQQFSASPVPAHAGTLLATVERSTWRGRAKLQLRMLDYQL